MARKLSAQQKAANTRKKNREAKTLLSGTVEVAQQASPKFPEGTEQHLIVTIVMRECENIEITGAKNVDVSDGGYYVRVVSPGTY